MSVVKDDAYAKRQEAFLTKLFQLHQMNGNPIKRIPLLGGKELDLYHLYEKVQSLGGSEKVTKDRMWGEVARSFNLPPSVTSASYACRQNFIKFLEQYETLDHNGTPFDPETYVPPVVHTPQTTTGLGSSHHLLRSSASPLSPHLANQLQMHTLGGGRAQAKAPPLATAAAIPGLPNLLQFTPAQFQQLQLLLKLQASQIEEQCHVIHSARYDWLVRSLQCGLPNEVDFAFNALTILSHDDKRIVPMSASPHLLDAVLAHIGLFSPDDPGLELLYHDAWHKESDQDYHEFWNEVVPPWVFLAVFPQGAGKGPRFPALFPRRSILRGEGRGVERLRAEQVANILRNLSFEECNAKYLAQKEIIVRFLFLAVNCSLPVVKMCALDILTNIAHHLLISRDTLDPSYLLLSSLHQCVLSDDRLAILRGMETIGQLAWCLHNEAALARTPPDVYQRMVQLLLVLDCQLILTSLDALYNLSFYGEQVARAILEVAHSVDTLVHLLTVTVEDMGTAAVEGLSLVHANGQVEPLVKRNESLSLENIAMKATSTSTRSSELNKLSPPSGVAVSAVVSAQVRSPSTVASVPKVATTVSASSPAAAATTPTSSRTPAVAPRIVPLLQGVADKAASPTLDATGSAKMASRFNSSGLLSQKSLPKELFATEWLRSEYETSQEAFVSKVEIFSRYLSHCSLVGQTELVSQNEIDTILRKLFPEVTFTNVKIGSQDIGLVGGVVRRKHVPPGQVPAKLPWMPHATLTPSLATKETSAESVSTTTSKALVSSSSLSPLQQLILATKTQNAMVAAVSKANHAPSPLLIANKMPVHLPTNQVVPVGNVVTCAASGVNVTALLQKNLLNLVAATRGKTPPIKDASAPETSSSAGTPSDGALTVQTSPSLPASGVAPLVNGKASREEIMLMEGRKRPRSTSPLSSEELVMSMKASKTQLRDQVHVRKLDSHLIVPGMPTVSLSSVRPVLSAPSLAPNGHSSSASSSRESSPLPVDNSVPLPRVVVVGHQTAPTTPCPLAPPRSTSPSLDRSSSASSPASTNPEPFASKSESSNASLAGSRLPPSRSEASERILTPCQLPLSCVATGLPEISKTVDSPSSISSLGSTAIDPKLICLWANCLQIRASWGDLFRHIVYEHISQLESFPAVCVWAGCPSKCRRMRPSLIRHIQTHHCSSDPKPVPPNVADTLMKLKSMSPFEVEKESQLTRTIRLTSALVLRNLMQTLPAVKRHLIGHEQTLAQVALSGTEASSIAAQCLSYLVTSPSPPPPPTLT